MCVYVMLCLFFFFFKQKTSYELRISDWSSDVCSSDLPYKTSSHGASAGRDESQNRCRIAPAIREKSKFSCHLSYPPHRRRPSRLVVCGGDRPGPGGHPGRRVRDPGSRLRIGACCGPERARSRPRSEEHTSELQSLMRISYAVFCLKKK